jgi:hypothetical protein
LGRTFSSSVGTTARSTATIFFSSISVRLIPSLRLHRLTNLKVSLAFEPRSTLGKAPSARGYHVTLLADSRLFLFGGFNGSTPFDEVHILDLAAAAYLPQVTHFDIQLPE